MIKKIGIIGSGKMGSNIIEYLLSFDFELTWICRREESVPLLEKFIRRKLKRSLKLKDCYSEENFQAALKKIKIGTSLSLLKNYDLIIESVKEDKKIKTALFDRLQKITDPQTIVVSNTSSLPLKELFKHYPFENRCCGYHFFYPLQYKNIIEIASTAKLDNDALEKLIHFTEKINKQYLVLDNTNHFILNRLFIPLQAQAYLFWEEGVLTIKEIDDIIRDSLFPMGIFEFIDSVGVNIINPSVKNYLSFYENKDFFKPWIDAMDKMQTEGIKFYDKVFPAKKAPGNFSRENLEKYKERITNILKALYLKEFSRAARTIDSVKLNEAVMEYWGLDKGPIQSLKDWGIDKFDNEPEKYYRITNA